jgi:hypothetical protein
MQTPCAADVRLLNSNCMAPTVKLFVAVLSHPEIDISYPTQMLGEVFGSIDYTGRALPFNCTTYYEQEMGPNLSRAILGFRGPHTADILVSAKLACIELEKGCAVEGNRRVNLDIGYLDHHKIVLASTKAAGQKIYMDRDIYADLVARYEKGGYQAMPWAFPDFKDGRYGDDFLALRSLLMRVDNS